MNKYNVDINDDDQWSEAIDRQIENENQARYQGIVGDQAANFADVAGAVEAVNRQQAQKGIDMQNTTASLMKLANGGRVPQTAIDYWNRRYPLNKDGSGSILQEAGYDDKGNYVMTFTDANGENATNMTASELDQYQMMHNMPGIFSDEDRMALGNRLQEKGYSQKEMAKYSTGLSAPKGGEWLGNRIAENGYGAGGRLIGTAGGSEGENSMNAMLVPNSHTHIERYTENPTGKEPMTKYVSDSRTVSRWEGTDSGAKPGRRPKVGSISYFAADGKGGFSRGETNLETGERTSEDWGTRAKDAQGRWRLSVSGQGSKIYENDKTGDRITVKDNETLREALSNTNDKLNKAKIKQMEADANLKNAQAQNGSSSGLTFEQRKELEQMRLDAANKRAKDKNNLSSRLGQIKSIEAQIKGAEKELSEYQGSAGARNDPDKDKKIAAYRQKIDELTAKREQLFEVNDEPDDSQGEAAENTSVDNQGQVVSDGVYNNGNGQQNQEDEPISKGYSLGQITELKKRGYHWDSKQHIFIK